MPRGSVQRCGGDGAGRELEAEGREHGVVDKGPRGVAERLVLADVEETDEVVEDAVRLFELQVEAERLQQQILVVEDRVAPFPELLGLLVYLQVGLLLGHPAARHDQLAHAPDVLFDLGG